MGLYELAVSTNAQVVVDSACKVNFVVPETARLSEGMFPAWALIVTPAVVVPLTVMSPPLVPSTPLVMFPPVCTDLATANPPLMIFAATVEDDASRV